MYEIYCKLRDEKGLKDADIVKATGITKSTFSDWKNGRSKPKSEKLQKIADFFEVSIDYLQTGKEPNDLILYTDENADFLLAITKNITNKDYKERLEKYIAVMNNQTVNDVINLTYQNLKKEES